MGPQCWSLREKLSRPSGTSFATALFRALKRRAEVSRPCRGWVDISGLPSAYALG